MVASARDPSGEENQESPEGRRRLQFSVGPTQAGYFFSAQLPSSSSCCSRSSGLLGPRLPGALQGGGQLWRGEGKARLGPAARSSAERGAGTLLAEWKRGR